MTDVVRHESLKPALRKKFLGGGLHVLADNARADDALAKALNFERGRVCRALLPCRLAEEERAASVAPDVAAPYGKVADEQIAFFQHKVSGRPFYRARPDSADEVSDELVAFGSADAVDRLSDELVCVFLGNARLKAVSQRLVCRIICLKRTFNLLYHNPSNLSRPSNHLLVAHHHRARVVLDRHELHASPLPDVEVALRVAAKHDSLRQYLATALV